MPSSNVSGVNSHETYKKRAKISIRLCAGALGIHMLGSCIIPESVWMPITWYLLLFSCLVPSVTFAARALRGVRKYGTEDILFEAVVGGGLSGLLLLLIVWQLLTLL